MIDEERLRRVHAAAANGSNGASERSASAAPDSASESTEPADPWQAELARACADIKAKLKPSATARAPLFDLDLVDLLQQRFEAARWLVTGLITRGGVAMIGGEPKAMVKTWSATELALAVATGTKAFGEFFAEPGVVVYFYAEDLDVQVRNRTRALLAGSERTIARGRFHPRPRGAFLDILRDEDLAWIVASVRKLGTVALLVLDPLRDIHGGEEDKSDSMREVMRRLRLLADLLGCTVLVVHHAVKRNKDNVGRRPGQNFRGSSAIHGSLDAVLSIQDADGDGSNVFTTSVAPQVKGARSAAPFGLELSLTDDDNGEATIASWRYESKSKEKAAATNALDLDLDAVFVWVRELAMLGIVLTKTQLKERIDRPTGANGRPIGQKRVVQLIEHLARATPTARARLVIGDGFVRIAGSEGSAND